MAAVLLSSCASTELAPDIVPVTGFVADRYLGTWYEIARIENRFEKGMTHVTANYSRREDGGIEVINRGYKPNKDKWSTANGKAYFVGDQDKGHLKVSFFGPIYGPYVVFDLAPDYSYSFVSDNDKDFLWFLSRTPTVDADLKEKFEARIKAMNFDTSDLIWVDQSDATKP